MQFREAAASLHAWPPRWAEEMKRAEFERKLDIVTAKVIEYAKENVLQRTPDQFAYRFGAPEVSQAMEEAGFELIGKEAFPNHHEDRVYSREEIVDALWRNDRVPEWINIALDDLNATHAILGLTFSGRFTDRDELLRKNEHPPFRIYGVLIRGDRVESCRVDGKIDLTKR